MFFHRGPSANHSMVRLDDLDADRPEDAAPIDEAPPQGVNETPRVTADNGGSTDVIASLLLAVANGDHEAFVALEHRIAGLVRVNILRVLRDTSRSDAVTQEFFAAVLQEAISFDPHRESAQAWLLTRAHVRAMDGIARATPQFVDGPTSAPRSPNPVDDLSHEEIGAHPIKVTVTGNREVASEPAVLLPL